MNIRTSVLALVLILLSSCGSTAERRETSMQHGVSEPQRVHMALRVLEETSHGKVVGILLQNSAEVPIQSIRSWVRFDPIEVDVSDLAIEDGRFSLFAPGEREIDSDNGFIKLGGAAKGPVADREILFASFRVRTSSDDSVLTFHDWNERGDGHTAVLTIRPVSDAEERGIAVNVLQAPSSLAL